MPEPTKILLANYPKINQRASFQQVDGTNVIDIITGYDIDVEPEKVTLQIVSDLAIAMLTYDQVYLLGNNVYDVVQVWTSDCFKILLREGIIKVIPDGELNPVLKKEADGNWKHDFWGYSNGCIDLSTNQSNYFKHPLGNIENSLFKKGLPQQDINTLLYLIQDNASPLVSKHIRKQIEDETSRDMLRTEFLTDQEFYRINNGRPEYNMISKLRLHHLNTLMCISAEKGLDGLKTDGAIRDIMGKKVSSTMKPVVALDGVDAIQCIAQQKDFPDIGLLLRAGILSLGDLLRLRNTFNGKMFRYWAKMDNYEESQMRKDIMNSVHNVLGSKVSQTVRMLSCNLVGLAGFLPGVVSSAFDSFVMGKIANGWHPNFFLDDNLKVLIDNKVSAENERKKQMELEARFKGVGRNDLCPCGSGKKFKNCHGK